MSTPVIRVLGTATREVEPDRVSVAVAVKTAVQAGQREALEHALQVRREISEQARSRFPDARVSDSRVTVAEHHVERETARDDFARVDKEWVVAGYYGVCAITVEADAARATEIFAALGAGDEYRAQPPAFFLSDALRREVEAELEVEAVRVARTRAERLAEAAECTLGGVLTIGDDAPPQVHHARAMAFEPIETAHRSFEEMTELIGEIRPDPVRVDAAVPVRFAIVAR